MRLGDLYDSGAGPARSFSSNGDYITPNRWGSWQYQWQSVVNAIQALTPAPQNVLLVPANGPYQEEPDAAWSCWKGDLEHLAAVRTLERLVVVMVGRPIIGIA